MTPTHSVLIRINHSFYIEFNAVKMHDDEINVDSFVRVDALGDIYVDGGVIVLSPKKDHLTFRQGIYSFVAKVLETSVDEDGSEKFDCCAGFAENIEISCKARITEPQSEE